MTVCDPLKNERSYVKNIIPSYPEQEWIGTPSLAELPGGICFESNGWLTSILLNNALPKQQKPDPEISYRPAKAGPADDDLLRFKYTFNGMHITLYESGMIVYLDIVEFPEEVNKEKDLGKKATLLGAQLFNTDIPLQFKLISQEGSSTLYSTNPECTIGKIKNWWDRIDCSANENRMIFIVFKARLENNRAPVTPSKWFPPEMRSWNKKQNSKGLIRNRRIRYGYPRIRVHRYARFHRIPRTTGIILDGRVFNDDVPRMVVGDEKDRRAERIHCIVFD